MTEKPRRPALETESRRGPPAIVTLRAVALGAWAKLAKALEAPGAALPPSGEGAHVQGG